MQHDLESSPLLPQAGCCTVNVPAAARDQHSPGKPAERKSSRTVRDESRYLKIIPTELLSRDDSEGDLSQYIREGDVVLDLGSSGGTSCYIAAQIVGEQGRAIAVESDTARLTLARKHQPEFTARLGYSNIEFRKGRLPDLRLDLDQLEAWLLEHPARTSDDWLQTERRAEQLRQATPLIADDSVDIVLSLGHLNSIPRANKQQLFAEIYRVLKRGGRVVLSDLTSDEEVPPDLRDDSVLGSDGLSNAYREVALLEAFEAAGFHGIEILNRSVEPCETVAGMEFRRMTVQAFKGKAGPCLDRKQAVIYNGPWKAVVDDDGHTLFRGQRMAVCDKTFQLYSQAPYSEDITPVLPAVNIPLSQARPFDCSVNAIRDPRETKSTGPASTPLLPLSDGCGPSGCC